MKYRAVALMCLGSIPVLAQSPNEREGQPRSAGGSPMADALDTDKDGVISSEELKNAANALLKLDKNKDGKLTETALSINPKSTHTQRQSVAKMQGTE